MVLYSKYFDLIEYMLLQHFFRCFFFLKSLNELIIQMPFLESNYRKKFDCQSLKYRYQTILNFFYGLPKHYIQLGKQSINYINVCIFTYKLTLKVS